MENLFFRWLNDPTGALYELFNRSVFYILVAIAGSVVTYFWAKIRFSARAQWIRLFNQSISYEGADTYSGLIVTIGTNTTLQQLIVDQIKPKYVAVVTGNTDEIKQAAQDFCGYLSAKKIIFDEPRFYKELDLMRIEQGFDELIAWMESKNIQKENIVIDLTGGKTPFSIAAFNSARRNGVHSVYTDSDYDAGKVKAGTQHSILLT
jgi:hypothetical protein